MEQRIKEDILAVLEKAVIALSSEAHPNHELAKISNQVIHNASVYQDHDSVSVAVLIYALSKALQRCCEKSEMNYEAFSDRLQRAYDALVTDDYEGFHLQLKFLFGAVHKLDSKLKLYIQEVLDKARLKKGTKMHEHGISLARTAEIFGISRWELMDYLGKTTMPEDGIGLTVKQRLTMARSLFR